MMHAVHFDGTKTIKLGNDAHFDLDGCDDMTYEMWFRPTSASTSGWLMIKNAANGIKVDANLRLTSAFPSPLPYLSFPTYPTHHMFAVFLQFAGMSSPMQTYAGVGPYCVHAKANWQVSSLLCTIPCRFLQLTTARLPFRFHDPLPLGRLVLGTTLPWSIRAAPIPCT